VLKTGEKNRRHGPNVTGKLAKIILLICQEWWKLSVLNIGGRKHRHVANVTGKLPTLSCKLVLIYFLH
jgi:hypothetical protein